MTVDGYIQSVDVDEIMTFFLFNLRKWWFDNHLLPKDDYLAAIWESSLLFIQHFIKILGVQLPEEKNDHSEIECIKEAKSKGHKPKT